MKILELFGGIGAPRKALINLGVDVKSIDYVEIDKKAVRTYDAIYDNRHTTQDVCGWDLKPDILVHGSPCQDFSIAGHQKGGKKGSGTQSSLMWETIRIIKDFGTWRPRLVVWENVKNVISRHMVDNFNLYLQSLEKLGYTNRFAVLDARNYGLPQARERVFVVYGVTNRYPIGFIPQARERVFVVSVLRGKGFSFQSMKQRPMRPLGEFLESDADERYIVTQPSVLNCIGNKGVRRTTVISDYAYTVTTRQDRTPAQVVALGGGRYRYLTERECWRLQGFDDEDFNAALAMHPTKGRMNRTLYKQAGNSMPVNVLEALFEVVL